MTPTLARCGSGSENTSNSPSTLRVPSSLRGGPSRDNRGKQNSSVTNVLRPRPVPRPFPYGSEDDAVSKVETLGCRKGRGRGVVGTTGGVSEGVDVGIRE